MKLCGQTFDESRVGFARATTQLMIEMANNEPPVTKIDEFMQQRDRIAAARNADEVLLVLRKLLENLQLETTVICSALPHPFFFNASRSPWRATRQQSGAWHKRLYINEAFDNE